MSRESLLQMIQQAKSGAILPEAQSRELFFQIVEEANDDDMTDFRDYHLLIEGALWLLQDGVLAVQLYALHRSHGLSSDDAKIAQTIKDFRESRDTVTTQISIFEMMVTSNSISHG